jgi:hypothetical protein
MVSLKTSRIQDRHCESRDALARTDVSRRTSHVRCIALKKVPM